MVRWQRSGLIRGIAGGTFAACWSELQLTVVQGGLAEKGIHRHSRKRLPKRTICFTSCVLGSTCGVSPHLFQEGRTVEVMVGSQARLDHYLLLYHQGSASPHKITCMLFHSPLCLVESNCRASPSFPAEKVVVIILLAWQI